MTELPDIYQSLAKEDLFIAFKAQLKKDFESCSLDTAFVDQLPRFFNDLRALLVEQIKRMGKMSDQTLFQLLYRIDITESQIKKYLQSNQTLTYEEGLAELIIKRILQKVVFKKHYSA